MSEIEVHVVHVNDWGSFLFMNGFLYRSGSYLEHFHRALFYIIAENKHFIMNYMDPIEVKFKKSVIDKCPYNTYHNVEMGIHIDNFMQWFKKI